MSKNDRLIEDLIYYCHKYKYRCESMFVSLIPYIYKGLNVNG
jgi:hypothetical protein